MYRPNSGAYPATPAGLEYFQNKLSSLSPPRDSNQGTCRRERAAPFLSPAASLLPKRRGSGKFSLSQYRRKISPALKMPKLGGARLPANRRSFLKILARGERSAKRGHPAECRKNSPGKRKSGSLGRRRSKSIARVLLLVL